MKQNKKTTAKTATKTKTKKTATTCACTKEKKQIAESEARIVALTTGEDLRNSVLIVSLVVNLFFLVAWVALQVTTQYDAAVANALFSR